MELDTQNRGRSSRSYAPVGAGPPLIRQFLWSKRCHRGVIRGLVAGCVAWSQQVLKVLVRGGETFGGPSARIPDCAANHLNIVTDLLADTNETRLEGS